MPTDHELESLWWSIESGDAKEQDRINAAAWSGKLHRQKDVDRLLALLEDPSDQVRWFALQSLVFDLSHLESSLRTKCWTLLDLDPSADVRSMAAASLGKFLANFRSVEGFLRLVQALKKSDVPAQVKGAVYRALYTAAGRPPAEWPGLFTHAKPFREADVNWSRVAELEDSYRSASIANL